MKREVIFEVGSEGGTIALFREDSGTGWRLRVGLDETAAYDALSQDDQVGIVPASSSPQLGTLDEAFKQLDRYPWSRLTPMQVHPEFRTAILKAVEERLARRPDGGIEKLRQWHAVAGVPAPIYREGMLIELSAKPEWGPGKIIHIKEDKLYVFFRDWEETSTKTYKANSPALKMAATQRDSQLEHLPPFVWKDNNWGLPHKRLNFAGAMNLFYEAFPLGFADPRYLEEVQEKRKAQARFRDIFEIEAAKTLLAVDDVAELRKRASAILGEVGFLLARFEIAAFHDAMKDIDAARSFFTSLIALLDSPRVTQELIADYFDSVLALPAERARVASWPVATLFLYIADPTRYMFLKPEDTKKAAERLAFDLHYHTQPNWTTYEALLQMSEQYLNLLQPLGAKDFIDVQSFVFVAAGGYK